MNKREKLLSEILSMK